MEFDSGLHLPDRVFAARRASLTSNRHTGIREGKCLVGSIIGPPILGTAYCAGMSAADRDALVACLRRLPRK